MFFLLAILTFHPAPPMADSHSLLDLTSTWSSCRIKEMTWYKDIILYLTPYSDLICDPNINLPFVCLLVHQSLCPSIHHIFKILIEGKNEARPSPSLQHISSLVSQTELKCFWLFLSIFARFCLFLPVFACLCLFLLPHIPHKRWYVDNSGHLDSRQLKSNQLGLIIKLEETTLHV